MADMVAKGRAVGTSKPGETNGQAKLTEAQVREILARRKGGATQQCIADDFGIARTVISRIETGALWRHLR